MTGLRRLFGGAPEPSADLDARLIAEMTAAGFDLSQPLAVEHVLTFREERPARQVVALLAGLGGELRLGHSGRRWVVQLTLPMRVTRERIAALREQLEAVAASHGGEYDGWGAPAP
ncbi:MAG TPA: ribonuclease E inhibitor RraB [Candidatus Limnocylindrales bacterium]|nr:ribonuclease E inhibitor RraB [Candidatus Limnocylindrales bacterium]